MNIRTIATTIALILIVVCLGWLLLTTIGLIFSALLFAFNFPLISLGICAGIFAAAALIVKLFKL